MEQGLVISWSHWAVFIATICAFLALDLGVFHKKSHVVKFKEALSWTAVWFTLAMIFALGLRHYLGSTQAVEFFTGYVVELSLSMDNVFVIALIFRYFRVPAIYQHRVLFWGILGALIMRGAMIIAGAALISRFEWTLYAFGAFLVFTGIKMLFSKEDGVHPESNPLIKCAKKLLPVSHDFDHHHFLTFKNGKKMLTPLALVLLMVETTDLIFALDSIPAIFGITTDPFVVFTSNVFAILGLRSLYFVLAEAIDYFRYLKYGLSVVLVFIGAKMLSAKAFHLDTSLSLGIVGAIIATSVLASIISKRA